jgi:hypothetical protein
MFEGVEENQLLGWKLANNFYFTGTVKWLIYSMYDEQK